MRISYKLKKSILFLWLLIPFVSFAQNKQLKRAQIKNVKKVVRVILQEENEYPYFFKYDSIISFKGIPKKKLKKINLYLKKKFFTFLKNYNDDKKTTTYNSEEELKTYQDNSKLHMVYITYLIDYTTTFLTIGNMETWCCSQGGLSGFHHSPSYSIAIETLQPILLKNLFYDGFKNVLIEKIRNHPHLKDLEEDGKVIQQYICEDEKKDFLIQKIKNATNTSEISLWSSGINLISNEVENCYEIQKHEMDGSNSLEIGAHFPEIKKHIKPNKYFIFEN